MRFALRATYTRGKPVLLEDSFTLVALHKPMVNGKVYPCAAIHARNPEASHRTATSASKKKKKGRPRTPMHARSKRDREDDFDY